LLLGSACSNSSPPDDQSEAACSADTTAITAVQGDGYYSPHEDTELSVRGIITRVDSGKGFYLEEAGPDTSPRNSNAIFVADRALSHSVKPGQQLEVTGQVDETGSARDKMTALIGITSHVLCAERLKIPLSRATLPLDSREREALEGMRVLFEQALSVTDVYTQHRGELTLSSNGVLRIPTEIHGPGASAGKQVRENRNRSLEAVLPEAFRTPVSVGTVLDRVPGVMGHDGRDQVFLLESGPENDGSAKRFVEPPSSGALRIVSLNLHNFFNGDGLGGGFPTDRGAKTQEEFSAQAARIQAALELMKADLYAVQELENDGFGPASAAHSFLQLLDASGNGPWEVIAPAAGRVGDDAIAVGLFYRQPALAPVGPAQVLDGPEFRGLSRHPLAQLFQDRASREHLLVAVNHLKSKGRCPESGKNTDQGDGQACWNQARIDAARVQIPWLGNLARKSGHNNILVLGDFNAWRKEEPVRLFKAEGFIDLVESLSGLPQYSYLYWGQRGTLDYAFASPALLKSTRRAGIWHINADWPRNMKLPEPWLRMSDHDPVIVDLDFSQSATSD